jgi:hypothetical protein
MRCHEEDEHPEMSGARTQVSRSAGAIPGIAVPPARVSSETGNGPLEQDSDGCATLEVPESRENDGSAARRRPLAAASAPSSGSLLPAAPQDVTRALDAAPPS